MTTGEFAGEYQDPCHYGEVLVERYTETLHRAAEIAYPDRSGEDLTTVFPEPTQPRDQAPNPDWTDEQAAEMRSTIAELGPGRKEDRTLTELGLGDAEVIFEGGQPHKIKAEVELVLKDAAAAPASFIFSGSAQRRLTTPGERESAERQLGYVPETECDVARAIAEQMPGFTPHEDGPQVLPLSYDIRSRFALGEEESGQFTLIGYKDDAPVILFRVDQEDYVDSDGKNKYRNRPGPADIMKIVSGALQLQGESETSLAFVTSGTYQASREIDGVRAGIATGRIIGVPTYGTARLAEVKGEKIPGPAPLNQIPGELHVIAQNVRKLAAELGQPGEA